MNKIYIIFIIFLFNGCFDDKLLKKEILDAKIIEINNKTNSSILVDLNGKKEDLFISISCVLRNDLINKITKISKETYITKNKKEYYKINKILDKSEYCK